MFIKIKLFLVNLFHRFFYTRSEYESMDRSAQSWSRQYTALNAAMDELREKNDTLTRDLGERMITCSQQQEQIGILSGQLREMEDLVAEQKRKIDQFDEYKRVDAEYLRDVQKQLAEEFHMHPVFGFPNSVGLPGSTSIITTRTGYTQSEEGYTTAHGRVILDDELTRAINQTPHIYEKLQLILGYLDRYGNLSRIMRDLAYNGGLSITLAYREDTTTYEAFFETTAKNYAANALLKFDSDTGCVVKDKDEEKKEEG